MDALIEFLKLAKYPFKKIEWEGSMIGVNAPKMDFLVFDNAHDDNLGMYLNTGCHELTMVNLPVELVIQVITNARMSSVMDFVRRTENKRYTVVGSRVVEHEKGPFLPTGEMDLSLINPTWKASVLTDQRVTFSIPEEVSEDIDQVVKTWLKKRAIYCQWMAKEIGNEEAAS